MSENENLEQRLALAEVQAERSKVRLIIAEAQVERSKAVMDSLAGFCHALGQPATVILSSVELLQMDGVDDETKREVLVACQEAALEIRSLLAQMKEKREYVKEAYLAADEKAGDMISLKEWKDKAPPKCSWEK